MDEERQHEQHAGCDGAETSGTQDFRRGDGHPYFSLFRRCCGSLTSGANKSHAISIPIPLVDASPFGPTPHADPSFACSARSDLSDACSQRTKKLSTAT